MFGFLFKRGKNAEKDKEKTKKGNNNDKTNRNSFSDPVPTSTPNKNDDEEDSTKSSKTPSTITITTTPPLERDSSTTNLSSPSQIKFPSTTPNNETKTTSHSSHEKDNNANEKTLSVPSTSSLSLVSNTTTDSFSVSSSSSSNKYYSCPSSVNQISGSSITPSSSVITLSSNELLSSTKNDSSESPLSAIEFIDDEESPIESSVSEDPTVNMEEARRNSIFSIDEEESWRKKVQKSLLKDAEDKLVAHHQQFEALRSKLISKETEISCLKADLSLLRVDRDNKVGDIQSLQLKLTAVRDQNELELRRINDFEALVAKLRTKNSELSDELLKKSEQMNSMVMENEAKKNNNYDEGGCLKVQVKELEAKLKDLENEKRTLSSDRELTEKEKASEITALQSALDDALETKISLQKKYEKEVQELQESNSTLVDDFEWKLHNVEAACRKKLQEKDLQVEQAVKEAKLANSVNIDAEKKQLEEDKQLLQQQMRKVEHLKAFEVEVIQLQGVTTEQQKAIRAAAREIETYRGSQRVLENEITSLRSLLQGEKAQVSILTGSTQRKLEAQEAGLNTKMDRLRTELNSKV